MTTLSLDAQFYPDYPSQKIQGYIWQDRTVPTLEALGALWCFTHKIGVPTSCRPCHQRKSAAILLDSIIHTNKSLRVHSSDIIVKGQEAQTSLLIDISILTYRKITLNEYKKLASMKIFKQKLNYTYSNWCLWNRNLY